MSAPRSQPSTTAILGGRSLLSEVLAGRLAGALDAAGVDALIIKGPVTERWLHDPGETRTIHDVDVVVDPGHYARAEAVLLRMGFVNLYDGAAPDWAAEHADSWVSSDGNLPVDLHRRIWGFGVPPATVWERL
jgi:hypothetical protein